MRSTTPLGYSGPAPMKPLIKPTNSTKISPQKIPPHKGVSLIGVVAPSRCYAPPMQNRFPSHAARRGHADSEPRTVRCDPGETPITGTTATTAQAQALAPRRPGVIHVTEGQ